METYKNFKIDWNYFFAGLICILFIMSRWFLPEFVENENIYSIHPLKMLDPEYLENDPFMGGISYFNIIFSVACLPFYALFDHLIAVMIIRVIIWSFQIWALSKLTKTLGLKWWAFIFFIIIWLNVPTRLAGEWVIRSAESKPVAYGFIFLSINALLNDELKKSGIFSGIAVSFHVLAGGWSAVALFITVVLNNYKNREIKEIICFGINLLIFSLPGLLPAVYGLIGFQGSSEISGTASLINQNVDKICVTFANPFHLDPAYFIQGVEAIKVIFLFTVPIFLYKKFLKKEKSRAINTFLIILIVTFIIGIIARKLEIYKYLKYYPFRVADGLLPLNLWIGFSLMIQTVFDRLKYKKILACSLIPIIMITSNYLIDISEPKRRYSSFKKLLKRTEPRETAYRTKDTLERLHNKFVKKKFDGFDDMANWIKLNTPKDSIFLTPPWKYSFALKAQRAQVVTYKCVPIDKSLLAWKQRMEDLNGGKFIQEGKGWMYKELKSNYPKLTEYEILDMKKKYNVDYILTTNNGYKNFNIVYQNKIYTLYKIT